MIKQRSTYVDFCFSQSISILFLYASLFIASCLLLILNIPISPLHFCIGSLIWIVASWITFRRFSISIKIISITSFVTLFLLFSIGYLCSRVFDGYFDSQWYHMDAIIHLVKGWNPYYLYLSDDVTSGSNLYLNHFPKAPWIVSADLFALTGSIEFAKCTTFLLIIAVFFYSQYFFIDTIKLPNGPSILISLLLAINPIAVLSTMSFYVDGHVAAFFLFAFFFSIAYLITRKTEYLYFALLSCFLLAHIKIMSSVYAFIIFAGIFISALILKTEALKSIFLKTALVAIFTFVIIGYHPFISNWKNAGHPLFPALGQSKSDLMSAVYPANFEGKNRFERFAISFFGKPEWARRPESAHFKQLFGKTQLWIYSEGVVEVGGWGPMMPEIVVVLIPFFLLIVFIYRRQKIIRYVLYAIGFISLTIIINPEAWCTRYVPQFWFIIISMVLVLWYFKWTRLFAVLFMISLILNVYLMAKVYFPSAIERSNKQKETFDILLPNQYKYDIYPGWTNSFKYRLEHYGFDPSKFYYNVSKSDTNFIKITSGMEAAYRLKADTAK